jgi:secreted trypsin-like serine protease
LILTENNLTGGIEGNDLCTGDGGSPLVCPIGSNPNFFYQAGIVTGGIECGQKDVPGLYVDIVKQRQWIYDKVKDFGITDTKYFEY